MNPLQNELRAETRSTRHARVEEELRRRAADYLEEKYLVVDYYRIRRKLAYPLPVQSLSLPAVPVPGIAEYPWATWMTWALEERVNCLGWAAEWFGDEACREAAASDLRHLAQWPQYRQYPSPDLSLGHAARLLALAARQWSWPDATLRAALAAALRRVVDDMAPLLAERWGAYDSHDAILAAAEGHTVLHNIRVIGTLGAALAANALSANALSANAPDEVAEKAVFNRYVHNIVAALFAWRERGHSEGVAYDGYVLDFIVDWLALLPLEQRSTFVSHPQFARYFEESLWLGAPGDVAQVAELSDVEATEMPFHISAQAKANGLQPLAERTWYLRQCRLERLRADALAALRTLPPDAASTPSPGAAHAQYAAVLRGGWKSEDVAVAVAASTSPLGHIHSDSGSLAIGARGAWFIQTPGYQQYLQTSEREFTLGLTARNTPALNGHAAIHKKVVVSLPEKKSSLCVELDLTACYPAELRLQKVTRRVQLFENRLVVVEDAIQGEAVQEIAYYWHGHRDAAWWIEGNWARLYLNGSTLWFGSPQLEIAGEHLQRLRGSRGQLTLAASTPVEPNSEARAIRWYFLLGETPPPESEIWRRRESPSSI